MNSLAMQHPIQTTTMPAQSRKEMGLGSTVSMLPGDLVIELAHDLRSPLTSIMSLTEHMLRGGGGPVTESQRRQLAIIYSASLCLTQTASGILELGRSPQAREDDRPGPFSLTELFGSVGTIVAPMVEEKQLELRILVEGEDGRTGPAATLTRVLLNLTINALKFTDEGVVELTARSVGPDLVELSVRDTGPGLDPQVMRTLFQSLPVSYPPESRYFTSPGLGLVLCRELVASLGSILEVESVAAWGTRFAFRVALPEVTRGRFPRRRSHPPLSA